MGKSFTSPCPYVPLHKYDWHSVDPYIFVKGCPPLPWNPVVYCFIAGSHAATYGLILELILQLFFTFRKRTTFYFWSLVTCLLGIAMFAISFDLRFFAFKVNSPVVILTGLGTILMVGGFNLTLYSRLNLITRNTTLLRAVFASIVVVCVLGKIPVLVSESIATPAAKKIYRISLYMDFLFTIEIFILGGLYIYLFRRHFMRGFGPTRRAKSTFQLLIMAQLVVAACDVIANVLLCMDFFLPTATVTPLRYAIKVKIEFVVLNRLVLFAKRESSSHLLPHIPSKDEKLSRDRFNKVQRLDRYVLSLDRAAGARLADRANQSSRTRNSGNAIKRVRSLPDLSVYKIIDRDRSISNETESSDKWSATDIRYLGRFYQDGGV